MFGAFPSVREQEKGLTSWLTHPKARAHSGDQPLRPEVVVPRNSRRAVVPVLLWPLRPEVVVPGPTAERSAPLAWPLRPEVVVPRNSRRAVVPVLLWPLRPEAMVPRTHRRAVGPSCLALATRGRGAEELPPSGCPCTSLALGTRGRGSWTVRRAVGPSCLLMTLAGYSDSLQLEAKMRIIARPCCSNVRLSVIMAPSTLRRTESAPAGTVRGPPTRR